MKIEARELGYILVFESTEEMEGILEQLNGFLEAIKEDNLEPPHLYARAHEDTPEDDLREILDSIKSRHRDLEE